MPKIVDLLDDAMNGPEYEERVSFWWADWYPNLPTTRRNRKQPTGLI